MLIPSHGLSRTWNQRRVPGREKSQGQPLAGTLAPDVFPWPSGPVPEDGEERLSTQIATALDDITGEANGQPGWSELAAAWKTPVQEERNNNPERPRIRRFGKCL